MVFLGFEPETACMEGTDESTELWRPHTLKFVYDITITNI